MIEKLRYKFIFITMTSVFVVMTGILILLNGFNYYHTVQRADDILAILADNNGTFPQLNEPPNGRMPDELVMPAAGFTSETPFETRFFKVVMDKNGRINQIDTSRIRSISTEEAGEYAIEVVDSERQSGYQNDFRFKQVVAADGSMMVLFVDNHRELETFRSFLKNAVLIGSVSFLLILLLVIVFSKRVVAPVQENLNKQKQFITDAGHEIKTPLTIISANNDVQELIDGESEWTKSTRNQIVRLNQLVEAMLALARMEEEGFLLKKETVSLSEIVAEEASPFQLLSDQRGQSFSVAIEADIILQANPDSLRQLCAILLDNAQKYVTEQGAIQLSLKTDKKKAVLSVQNTVAVMPEDLDRLFDRFYRENESRNQSAGGYGIGLSLAQAIVHQHGGSIHALALSNQHIQFQVVLPL